MVAVVSDFEMNVCVSPGVPRAALGVALAVGWHGGKRYGNDQWVSWYGDNEAEARGYVLTLEISHFHVLYF